MNPCDQINTGLIIENSPKIYAPQLVRRQQRRSEEFGSLYTLK